MVRLLMNLEQASGVEAIVRYIGKQRRVNYGIDLETGNYVSRIGGDEDQTRFIFRGQ
jgi:hypothetical protein